MKGWIEGSMESKMDAGMIGCWIDGEMDGCIGWVHGGMD